MARRKRDAEPDDEQADGADDDGGSSTAEPVVNEADAAAVAEANRIVASTFQQLEDPRLAIDLKLADELRGYRVFRVVDKESGKLVRGVPIYFHSEDDLEEIATTLDRAHAYRERAVHLLMKVSAIRRTVQELWDNAQAAASKTSLMKSAKPSQKKSVLRNLLLPIARRIDDADFIISMCKVKMKEMDDAYYSAKEISEVGKAVLSARIEKRRGQRKTNV